MNRRLDSIQCLNEGVEDHDKNIEELSNGPFAETNVLRQVHGVGPLIALAFVATIGDTVRSHQDRAGSRGWRSLVVDELFVLLGA